MVSILYGLWTFSAVSIIDMRGYLYLANPDVLDFDFLFPRPTVFAQFSVPVRPGIFKYCDDIHTTVAGKDNPDLSPTQRIGLIPDVEVHQTIQGIRNGTDELLEKAIEIIKHPIQ